MTIYDIAKQAGVSASTVSRVINGKPGIKESTREKVKKLLEENSYTPNAAARGLVMQSSRFIGILIEDIRVSHHTDSAYVISQEMMASGYTCITLSTGTEPEQKAKYIEILGQRQVEGAILVGSMFSSEDVKESIKKHLPDIPIVLVNGTMDLPNVYSILIHEEQGLQECVKYLMEQGRRNICYMQDLDTPANEKKLRGFCNEMKLSGIPEERWKIVTAPGTSASPNDSLARGYESAEKILSQYPDTDAVLCATDLLAIGCMQYLRERNISIPDRIAVMGVDNSLYGRVCTPTLSTLDNKLVELSRNAAHVLQDVLDGRSTSRKIMLFTDLILREST